MEKNQYLNTKKINDMNNTEKLHQAFVEGLSIPINAVNEELVYQGIAEWDSMAHMYLITAIESSFNIEIDTEDILNMTSYKQIRETLSKYNIIV
ncbi:acyl carrier protein [Olivibacter jilunii]|uniref:acyl carrier protein n=1 Tax=Olivibacter jilunii TaxID=985016 RepID=UPI003F18335C